MSVDTRKAETPDGGPSPPFPPASRWCSERVPATLERAGDEVETAADWAAAAEATHAGGETPLVVIGARSSPLCRSGRRGDAGVEARIHAAITLAATLTAPLAERRRTTVRLRVLERPRAGLSISERTEESVIRGLCELPEDLPDEAGPTPPG